MDVHMKSSHQKAEEYKDKRFETLTEEEQDQVFEMDNIIKLMLKGGDRFKGFYDEANKLIENLNENPDLKEIKLVYFLEQFRTSVDSNQRNSNIIEIENKFESAVKYLADELDDEEFLSKIYPNYFSD